MLRPCYFYLFSQVWVLFICSYTKSLLSFYSARAAWTQRRRSLFREWNTRVLPPVGGTLIKTLCDCWLPSRHPCTRLLLGCVGYMGWGWRVGWGILFNKLLVAFPCSDVAWLNQWFNVTSLTMQSGIVLLYHMWLADTYNTYLLKHFLYLGSYLYVYADIQGAVIHSRFHW